MAGIPGLFLQERRLIDSWYPSLTKNIGGQSIQGGEVIVTYVIATRDLELPSRDEEDETLAEQPPVEATPSTRRKRKETAHAQDSAALPKVSAESPPPPTRSKKLRKRTGVEFDEIEKPVAVPTETSGEKAQEKEKDVPTKEKEKRKEFKEEEEIPDERAEPTSSELALFDHVEAEHSVAAPELEVEAEYSVAAAPVPENKTAGVLAVVTSPFKPPIVSMPIHSLPGSYTTASFADSELAKFKAMDLDAQLDKLETLSSTPSKAKSKVMDRVKIWQSTELDLNENQETVDQLIKDLDLLHRKNMAPKPILEISLGLAKDVLNLHNRYEFCKATNEANLADYAKHKTELDQKDLDTCVLSNLFQHKHRISQDFHRLDSQLHQHFKAND
ncbi:unnamed protein product [Prunus armeniaca]